MYIKDTLSDLLGIPLHVNETRRGNEITWTISPLFDEDEFKFDVITHVSDIKVEVTFKPGAYSSPLFWQMSIADSEKKAVFRTFVNRIISEGGRISFQINNTPVELQDNEKWPSSPWKNIFLSLRHYHDIQNVNEYENIATHWSGYVLGMIFSLLNWHIHISGMPESSVTSQLMTDGKASQITVNRYERKPENRLLCLSKYGYTCQICGMNFEEKYGPKGKGLIEVHHLTPLSETGEVIVNPEKDLIPVCPNCHRMIHRRDPPYTPNELRDMLSGDKTNDTN